MTRRQWFDSICRDASLQRLADFALKHPAISVHGAAGSSSVVAAAALRVVTQRPVLLIMAHLDDADRALDEIADFGLQAIGLPALEAAPGETSAALDLQSERIAVARTLMQSGPFDVLVAPIAAIMQTLPDQSRLPQIVKSIRTGDSLRPVEFAHWLDDAGFVRRPTIESPGEYAIRGGVIDIFPVDGRQPLRLDLFGDEVERIFEIDLDSMASDQRLDSIDILNASVTPAPPGEGGVLVADLLPKETVAVLAEIGEITEQGRGYFDRVTDASGVVGPPAALSAIARRCSCLLEINQYSAASSAPLHSDLPVRKVPTFAGEAKEAMIELKALLSSHEVAVVASTEGELQRLRELLGEAGIADAVAVEQHRLARGFVWERDNSRPLAVVTLHDVLHRASARRRRVVSGRSGRREAFLQFEPGDYVVHRDHGIARFVGLTMLADESSDGVSEEFLTLEFDKGSTLHVPAARIDLVQRYIGAGTQRPQLSTIGGRRWKNQKEQVGEAVRDLAAELLRVNAARETAPGIRYPDDTPWQREFEAEFPYDETEDQLSAMVSIKKDMAAPRPMDRLLCGDVGFGKTELAIRAAFKAAEYGRQVAVLVPTTVLAEQHEITFRDRFRGYPFRVESISRFKSESRQAEVLKELGAGRVDIIIGTHRLLSKDVRFKDLGLVIVDEEQRFGVEHKQRLLSFRMTADVLTLSATPIPRTLHMAMLGLRDISSLTTPPPDRRAIVTEVFPANAHRVRQAINRELAREGQIFYVHNRVHNIQSVADDVQALAPDARVIVGHGQMAPGDLEEVMLRFMRRQADILVCTTIIESGIDIPTANTMIINNAHMFGLAELHQLRGRVGRSSHRAYCYLMTPADRPITEDAMKRLRAIEDYSMLGAGFRIAMRDLEIRGAGNILGPEQSGHISTVGYDLYCQLLEEAVAELTNSDRPAISETTVDLGVSGSIPKGYIPSDARRMDAYRRMSRASSRDELRAVVTDLESAYGKLPGSTETLVALNEVRIGAALRGVRQIIRRDDDLVFRTTDPPAMERVMTGAQGSLRMVGSPDESGIAEVYYRPPKAFLEPSTLLAVLRKRLA